MITGADLPLLFIYLQLFFAVTN